MLHCFMLLTVPNNKDGCSKEISGDQNNFLGPFFFLFFGIFFSVIPIDLNHFDRLDWQLWILKEKFEKKNEMFHNLPIDVDVFHHT